MKIFDCLRNPRSPLLAYILLFLVLPGTALGTEEEPNNYTKTWSTVYKPFKGEGALVEGADITGGHVFGSIGFIVGIPLGFVGGAITQVTHDDPDVGFDGTLEATSDGFSIVGKYLFGLPIYVIKKITYDLPATLIATDITYNKRKRRDGFGKVRH